MSVREALKKHPNLFAGGSLTVGLAVLGFSLRGYFGTHVPILTPPKGLLAFYTNNDGQTLFPGQFDLETPFDHDGKSAVKANVFTCDGGRHQWVQYLEKWSDDGRKQLESVKSGPVGTPPPDRSLILVKRPNSDKWVSFNDPAAHEITTPKCPDGTGLGPPDPVLP